MKRLGDAAREVEARARHAQWHWCRRPNGFCDRPAWRVIANQLGMPFYQVIAFVNRLEEFANEAGNKGYTRGEVSHFDAADFGEALGMPEEAAARIFAALEQKGWISFDHVADFYERNKDREDAGATLRQRRKYARDKLLKMLARLAALGLVEPHERAAIETSLRDLADDALFALVARVQLALSTGAFLTREERRESVSLTPEKSTHIQAQPVDNFGDGARGTAVGLPEEGVAGAASDPQGVARAWIAGEGRKLVVERMEWPLTRADVAIARWLEQQLEGDAAALALILQTEERKGYIGPRFHTDVTDAIARHMRQKAAGADPQGRLPLGGVRRVS